jgi:hypothetical protein
MKKETFEAVAAILGNGYTCFVNKKTEEVFSAEDISLAEQKSSEYKSFVPFEGKVVFGMMEEFTASVEDFSNQSELMEALTFEQPFSNFKQKVYKINLADDWIAFRTQKIVEILQG